MKTPKDNKSYPDLDSKNALDWAKNKINMKRIIFVGWHNKPHMSPLDSGTKTGKIIDKIIKELPEDIEIVKSNILNTDEPIELKECFSYANEWHWTHLPCHDDIIVLLGDITQRLHKENCRQVGKIIRLAHPASMFGQVKTDEYVKKAVKLILNQ